MTDNWLYPAPFVETVIPQSRDIDGLNHTNNAVYVGWCEQVAWQHSQSLGLSLQDYQDNNRALAITSAQYQYLAASYLDEKLQIGTWLADCDNKMKINRYFQVTRACDGKTLLTAQWQLLCIEISSGKPKRMPQEYIDIYGEAAMSTNR